MPERAFISMAVGFAGPVGFGYSVACGIIGYDPIAGTSLTPEERIAAVVPAVVVGAIAIVGKKLYGLAARATVAAERFNAERAAAAGVERAIVAEVSKAEAVAGIGRDIKVGEAAASALAGKAEVEASRAVRGAEAAARWLPEHGMPVIGHGGTAVEFAGRNPGYAALNLPAPQWSIRVNDSWVNSIISQRAPVRLSSPLTEENLWNAARGRPTVFGREVGQFLDAGYTQVGDWLQPRG